MNDMRGLRRRTAWLVLLAVVLTAALSGCGEEVERAFFLEGVTLETAEAVPDTDTQALLRAYFAWRADSFGRAAGAVPTEGWAEAPAMAEAVSAAEASRRECLKTMMDGWGCVYSGAKTTLRVDRTARAGRYTELWVYEAGYFAAWYPGYTGPDKADWSGNGVKHVLRIEDGRVAADIYHEGRPTGAKSGDFETDPSYIAYAGRVSPPPEAVEGRPPLLPVHRPRFSAGYDPGQALAYAEKWALSRNPAVHDYSLEGGDCCHFASQCLAAGGLPEEGDWKAGSLAYINSTRLYAYLTGPGGAGRGMAVIRQRDPAGRQAAAGGKTVKAARLLFPGSPVFYRWGGGYVGDSKWSHTALCVGYLGDGTPAVSSHTGDKYRIKWNYGGADCDYGTAQMTPGPGA